MLLFSVKSQSKIGISILSATIKTYYNYIHCDSTFASDFELISAGITQPGITNI